MTDAWSCPQNNCISLTNQPTGSILPSITQRSWRHLVIAFSFNLKPRSSQRRELIWKGFFSAEPKFLCMRVSVFAAERHQIVWLSCLSWWLLDFLWSNFHLCLFHLFVPCLSSPTGDFWAAGWSLGRDFSSCTLLGVVLNTCFSLSQRFRASSCELMWNNPTFQVTNGEQIVQLFFQIKSAGQVEFSVEMK